MTLDELLESIEAPEELVTRAREEAWAIEDAWERVEQADHRVWLAACASAPVERLVEAAAAAVWTTAERVADVPDVIGEAVRMAVEGASAAELRAAAASCEEVAEGAGSYRESAPPGLAALARAAGLVVSSADGLATGEARREAVRMQQAAKTGALIGAGAQITMPSAEGPARIDVRAAASDPAQGSFLYATAAAAEAVVECASALEKLPDGAALLDAAVREALEDT